MFDIHCEGSYSRGNFFANYMKIKGFATLTLAILGQVFLLSTSLADVYVYRDRQGVLNFTNVPNHAGYRRVLKEGDISARRAVYSSNNYDDIIRAASDRHSVDAELVRAVIKVESDFNSNARSHKGAMGLMQLMPDTARLHNVSDVYDPTNNIEGGVRHLRLLLNRFRGDLQLTLAAYNAGIKAVEKHGGIPPFVETREYVRRVLRYYENHAVTGLQTIQQLRQ